MAVSPKTATAPAMLAQTTGIVLVVGIVFMAMVGVEPFFLQAFEYCCKHVILQLGIHRCRTGTTKTGMRAGMS